jgi:hypothetical protein
MSDFTDGKLTASGTSRGVKESRNERGQVTGHTVQLLKRDAKNALQVIPVRLPEGADPTAYAEGKYVELPVDISNYEGTMYYRATREQGPPKAETRSGERSGTKVQGASL